MVLSVHYDTKITNVYLLETLVGANAWLSTKENNLLAVASCEIRCAALSYRQKMSIGTGWQRDICGSDGSHAEDTSPMVPWAVD